MLFVAGSCVTWHPCMVSRQVAYLVESETIVDLIDVGAGTTIPVVTFVPAHMSYYEVCDLEAESVWESWTR